MEKIAAHRTVQPEFATGMKSDVSFDFEHAAWPVLLVDGAGTVLRANQMALSVFGPATGNIYSKIIPYM